MVTDDGESRSTTSPRPARAASSSGRTVTDAALLVDTALLVGNERAIAAAVDVLGKDDAGALIPIVQPAALPAGRRHGRQAPRQGPQGAARRSSPTRPAPKTSPPLKIKRLSLLNIGMLDRRALRASAIAIPSLRGHRLGRRSRASSRTRPGAGPCSRSSSTRWCRRRGPPRSWAASTWTCRSCPTVLDPARVHAS